MFQDSIQDTTLYVDYGDISFFHMEAGGDGFLLFLPTNLFQIIKT